MLTMVVITILSGFCLTRALSTSANERTDFFIAFIIWIMTCSMFFMINILHTHRLTNLTRVQKDLPVRILFVPLLPSRKPARFANIIMLTYPRGSKRSQLHFESERT
ncbi:hypothetical protein BJ741DRAFT_595319 [Chytriomyces cf. hyalinus JEL632]|nr:hypothetical protein BJ741DRAFT_595319 [Chytriomyces cf. hyalinus JEL632]